MTIQLYLVRHGETPMNQNSQLQGITDMPLTPKGRQQAQATAALLASVPFNAAYSSDRIRAVDTAEIILAEHPVSCSIVGLVCANTISVVWKG